MKLGKMFLGLGLAIIAAVGGFFGITSFKKYIDNLINIENEQLLNEVKDKNKELTKLETQLSITRDMLVDKEIEYRNYYNLYNQVLSDINNMNETFIILQNFIDELFENETLHLNEIQNLQNELNALHNVYNNLLEDLQAYENSIYLLEEEIDNLNSYIAYLEEEIENSDGGIDSDVDLRTTKLNFKFNSTYSDNYTVYFIENNEIIETFDGGFDGIMQLDIKARYFYDTYIVVKNHEDTSFVSFTDYSSGFGMYFKNDENNEPYLVIRLATDFDYVDTIMSYYEHMVGISIIDLNSFIVPVTFKSNDLKKLSGYIYNSYAANNELEIITFSNDYEETFEIKLYDYYFNEAFSIDLNFGYYDEIESIEHEGLFVSSQNNGFISLRPSKDFNEYAFDLDGGENEPFIITINFKEWD